MTFMDCVAIVGISLASALVSEGISWVMIYRTEEYKRMKDLIERTNKKLEQEKGKVRGIDAKKQQDKKISKMESDLKEYERSMSMIKMKSMLVMTVTMLSVFGLLNSLYDGIPVAKLPFVPFGLVQGISHRNLAGEDFTHCSVTFLYVLSSFGIRGNIQKLFGFSPPKTSSNSGLFGMPAPPEPKTA